VPRTCAPGSGSRIALAAASVLLVAGCGVTTSGTAAAPSTSAGLAASSSSPSSSSPSSSGSLAIPETDDVETVDVPSVLAVDSGPTPADFAAGVRSLKVVQTGTGRLVVVPGAVAAPGRGRVVKVRVEVEAGIGVDATAFAAFVMATLNDPRGWGHGGTLRFARTGGAAQIRVVLASPTTSARLCRPLQTFGKLSCRTGNAAVLTSYRWVKAIPEYGSDRTGYRHYVLSHEVGHALGHGHRQCAGRGAVAPVMMQQTKGLKGCLPNPWPYPGRTV